MCKIKKTVMCIAIIVMILINFICNIPKENEENFMNSDATWHVLLTVKAMQDNPISVHKFLPIVTLSEDCDKYIPWGVTVPDKQGNYFYTSFMPLSFIIPYIYFQVTGLNVSEVSLYYFSFLIGLTCLLFSFRLFKGIFREKLNSFYILAIVSLIYCFSPEMIHNNGHIIWGQSIWQLAFIVQLNLFFDIYIGNRNTKGKRTIFNIMFLITPLIEWTGFISNFGFLLIFIFSKKLYDNHKEKLKICGMIIINTFLSALFFVLHFLFALDPQVLFQALHDRFLARSNGGNSLEIIQQIKYLLTGYVYSFSYLIIILIIAIIVIIYI